MSRGGSPPLNVHPTSVCSRGLNQTSSAAQPALRRSTYTAANRPGDRMAYGAWAWLAEAASAGSVCRPRCRFLACCNLSGHRGAVDRHGRARRLHAQPVESRPFGGWEPRRVAEFPPESDPAGASSPHVPLGHGGIKRPVIGEQPRGANFSWARVLDYSIFSSGVAGGGSQAVRLGHTRGRRERSYRPRSVECSARPGSNGHRRRPSSISKNGTSGSGTGRFHASRIGRSARVGGSFADTSLDGELSSGAHVVPTLGRVARYLC
jgi:hypothetical protein